MNSKKETNFRDEMGQESRSATVVYPRKSRMNSEQQERNNGMVKMGAESKWANCQDVLLLLTP